MCRGQGDRGARDRSHGKAELADRLRLWGSLRQGCGYFKLLLLLSFGSQETPILAPSLPSLCWSLPLPEGHSAG